MSHETLRTLGRRLVPVGWRGNARQDGPLKTREATGLRRI
jgi:hypothetical protein